MFKNAVGLSHIVVYKFCQTGLRNSWLVPRTPVEQVTSAAWIHSVLPLQESAKPKQLEDVHVIPSAQSALRRSTPQKCFSFVSTTHFQSDCSNTPPVRGRNCEKARFYPAGARDRESAQTSITCFRSEGMSNVASHCSLPRLN